MRATHLRLNMTLAHKIGIAFAIVLALVGIQAIVTVLLLDRVAWQSERVVSPALGRIDNVAHVEADLLRMRTLEYSSVWSRDDLVRQEYATEIRDLQASIQQDLTAYAAHSLDPGRAAALAEIRQGYQGYLVSHQELVGDLDQGAQAEALWEYLRFQPSFQSLNNEIHGLRHREYADIEATRDQTVQGVIWTRWILGCAVLFVGLAEGGIGWFVVRRVAWSLKSLEQGAQRIADENFGEPVPVPSERELAALAQALNTMMVTLPANRAERARLEQLRLNLLRERLTQVVGAQEEERARISRELHDQAGQGLIALHYGLSALKRRGHDVAVAEEIDRLISLASHTGKQISALAHDLRPSVLDDLGLTPALRSYLREFSERVGLEIEFSVNGVLPRLSAEAETTVFRVTQEALTNVAKHALAAHAWVNLGTRDGQVELEIRDDGRGFDTKDLDLAKVSTGNVRAGLGLIGIRERVALLGGTAEFASAPGAGTRLWIMFPLARNVKDVSPQCDEVGIAHDDLSPARR